MIEQKAEEKYNRQLKIMDVLFLISIFAYSFVITKTPAEIYLSYLPIFLLLPFFVLKYKFPKTLIFIFLPLIISGIGSILLGENEISQFIKIFAGLFASSLFFYYFIVHYSFDLKRLFIIFLKAALIISIIGVVQLISFRIGFSPLYNLTWIFNKWAMTGGGLGLRVNSIFSEPSYYATTLAPAFFVSALNIISKKPFFISKRTSIFIAVSYPISFSSLGFLVIFLTILLLLIRFGYLKFLVLVIPISIVAFYLVYNNIIEFQDRTQSFFEMVTTDDFNGYEVHGSSFVLFNNYHVATKNLAENPFFGTGLGSHQYAFKKYSLTNDMIDIGLDGNSKDANSLFLRTMSETGLFGIIFLFAFLIKNYQSFNSAYNEEIWAMSTGLLIMILVYFLRQGHYFYNGFPFFMWMYYYLKKMSNNPKSFGLETE